MPVTLVHLPLDLFDDGTVSGWRKEHGGYQVVSPDSLGDYTPSNDSVSLFTPPPSVEVHVDEAKASDVRTVAAKAEQDHLILVSKKPRTTFDKDTNIVYVSLGEPKNLGSYLSKTFGISKDTAEWCCHRRKNAVASVILARQIALSDRPENRDKCFDAMPADNLPWDLTDAICSGDVTGTSKATRSMIDKGAEPVALMFQVVGYIRKVLVSDVPGQQLIQPKSVGFFQGRKPSWIDVAGVSQFISDMSDAMLNSPKRSQISLLVAMNSGIAHYFRR